MKSRILTFLLIFLLLASSLILVSAEESRPAIEVFKGKPSRSYPLKIYIYLQAFEDEESKATFQCRNTEKILSILYDVLKELHRAITRFVDEYPEYRKLALIYFVNFSSVDGADITFKVVRKIQTNPDFSGLTKYAYGSEGVIKPVEVDVLCSLTDRGENVTFNIIMHELFHALGLLHANQSSTDDGFPELMHPGTSNDLREYPSTLDLYALYIVHFTDFNREVIMLPEDIEYKMIIPYSHELQALKQENKQLRDTLAKTQRENYILQGKLKRANSTIEFLERELESTKNDLNSYVKSYNILWFENRDLRNNLTRLYNACNQTVSLLVSKLNKTYNDYVNLTNRYNWLVGIYNNIYQDFQALREENNDLQQRLYLIGIVAYVGMSILGYIAISRGKKFNKLLDEYNKLLEYLGVEEHGREG